jgi:phosphinothricin acetyltransferase
MRDDDWPMVRAIYEEGIATGDATFQTSAPAWDAWNDGHLQTCRLVGVDAASGDVVAWAALSPVSARPVYVGVSEVSVYVAAVARGRGVGAQLLQALIAASEVDGRWTLQAGIFPENAASIAIPHLLTGNRSGTWSLNVTRNWRLTFRINTEEGAICDLDLEDYH